MAGLTRYSIDESYVDVHRLHLNEYRFPHPDSVVAASQAIPVDTLITQYPGPHPTLAADIARYVNAASENVLITAGSDEALRAIIDTTDHTTVIMGVPGYTHFEHYVRLRKLRLITYAIGLVTAADVHLASLRYHHDQMLAGCLVYICNPNNPTGDMWSLVNVAELATQYPKSLFLIDEAYIEFASVLNSTHIVDNAQALNSCSLVSLAIRLPNIIVTRTFSKSFGLAALRIGYAVGMPTLINTVAIATSPKAVSMLSMQVAAAALGELATYRANAITIHIESATIITILRDNGWWILGTSGNFFLIYVGDAGAACTSLSKYIQVRNRDNLPGLTGFIRVTVGNAADTIAILTAFSTIVPPIGLPYQMLYTSKALVTNCKTLMKQTLSILRSANFKFFATAGTLLGMIRHGGMIPWDDDGDLAYVRLPHRDQAITLVESFKAAGLTLQRNRTDAYWQIGTNAPGTCISPVHIDLFSYSARFIGDSYVYEVDDLRFREEQPDTTHCNTRYQSGELFPLREDYRFYDEIIPIPAQTLQVLTRALGPKFMIEAKMRCYDGSHITFNIHDYSPA